MKFKWKTIATTFLVTTLFSSNVFAATITIDGRPLTTKTPPTVVNGRVMVPARPIFEALGCKVTWNSSTQTISAINGSNLDSIDLVLNKSTAAINDKSCALDTPAQIINGSTMVPLRFVAEGFNCSVKWDSKTKNASITRNKKITTDYVPYSAGDKATLAQNIADGKVVYIDGQYWATPEYATSLTNGQMTYYNTSGDNEELIDMASRTSSPTDNVSDEYRWTNGGKYIFEKFGVNKDDLDFDYSQLEEFNSNKVYLYGFYNQELSNTKLVYAVNEITDEFLNAKDAPTQTFNSIRMYKENGTIYMNVLDLKNLDLYN